MAGVDYYREVLKVLKRYPLSFSIEEGVLFAQSECETISISPGHLDGTLNLGYLTLERRIAERTLNGCPGVDWFASLKKLSCQDRGDYVAIPSFDADLDLQTAVDLCAYLGDRISTRFFN